MTESLRAGFPAALNTLRRVRAIGRELQFRLAGTVGYWERRYRRGGVSGAGSEGRLARFKADFLNEFVAAHDIASVIEWGCGDGSQLALAQYPRYLGLDVARGAVERCMARFGDDPTKSFLWYDAGLLNDSAHFLRADLALSLDVVYHLVEDDLYRDYMRRLFASSSRWVVIYSPNLDAADLNFRLAPHVRPRRFTADVAELAGNFSQVAVSKNPFALSENEPDQTSWSDFYIFERRP